MPQRVWLRLNLYLVLCLSTSFIGLSAKLSLYHPVFESHQVTSASPAISLSSKMEISERFHFRPDFGLLVPVVPDLSAEWNLSLRSEISPEPIAPPGIFAAFWFKRPPPVL
jgi:hypothetical protein